MVWMFGRRVGKNDGDSGWGFVKLLGRFLADLLSRASRGWCLSRGVGPGPYAGAGFCALGTATRYSPSRLTDGRK
ncbi:hypothetical protein DPMN_124717 [Dreissena polymorpha]|uniref:Uncharacterized protein n=1 Tax=Dreissena polymorpha TaxID=45954 RepID=A0A9D4GTX1_DREPO|nr:hypothetical protein DPMN_124717 [Dreissena polymorpha]